MLCWSPTIARRQLGDIHRDPSGVVFRERPPSDGWASNAAPEESIQLSRDMLQAIVRPLRPARRLGHWSDHCTLLGVQA
jgi:hypothetical protein